MGILIGIGGVSRAGKTTLAKYLRENLTDAQILCQDDFVLPESQIPKIRNRVDWENPDSINWTSWTNAVQKSHQEKQFTILDGLFAFYDHGINSKMDISFYLTLDKSIFLDRKDQDERWGIEPEWFLTHIWESHIEFGLPKNIKNPNTIHDITSSDYTSIIQKISAIGMA